MDANLSLRDTYNKTALEQSKECAERSFTQEPYLILKYHSMLYDIKTKGLKGIEFKNEIEKVTQEIFHFIEHNPSLDGEKRIINTEFANLGHRKLFWAKKILIIPDNSAIEYAYSLLKNLAENTKSKFQDAAHREISELLSKGILRFENNQVIAMDESIDKFENRQSENHNNNLMLIQSKSTEKKEKSDKANAQILSLDEEETEPKIDPNKTKENLQIRNELFHRLKYDNGEPNIQREIELRNLFGSTSYTQPQLGSLNKVSTKLDIVRQHNLLNSDQLKVLQLKMDEVEEMDCTDKLIEQTREKIKNLETDLKKCEERNQKLKVQLGLKRKLSDLNTETSSTLNASQTDEQDQTHKKLKLNTKIKLSNRGLKI